MVVEDNVLIHGLETDNLSSSQEGIGVMHVEQVLVNFFVENVWEVLVLDSRWHLYFEHLSFVVETDYKKGGASDYLGWFGVELGKVVLGPLN